VSFRAAQEALEFDGVVRAFSGGQALLQSTPVGLGRLLPLGSPAGCLLKPAGAIEEPSQVLPRGASRVESDDDLIARGGIGVGYPRLIHAQTNCVEGRSQGFSAAAGLIGRSRVSLLTKLGEPTADVIERRPNGTGHLGPP